ncbi:MAG: hypothetical protein GX676_06560 [Bacilli bacterium]|nr:hypothetical protein [Bacilli bacterium]
MKEFWLTCKFLLKQNLSLNYLLYKTKHDKKARTMFIVLFIVILMCLPSYFTILRSVVGIFEGFHKLNMESLFIVMAIFISLLTIIIFGIFQFIGYFYFSNDIKLLTPLPIKPRNYLLSKFLFIYLIELIVNLLLVFTFFVIYGIKLNVTIYQWLGIIISFLLMPIVPLVIVGFITVLLMSLTNITKNRDTLRIMGYTIILVLTFIFQITVYQNLIPSSPEEQFDLLERLAENSQYFLDKFALYYPISKLISLSISGSFVEVILSIIGFLIISFIIIYLFSQFLQRVFINSYLKELDSPLKKKKIREKQVEGSNNTAFAIAKIDFNTIIKVPIFMFNTVALLIIVPVVLIISTLFMQQSSAGEVDQIVDLIQKYRYLFWLGLTLALVILSTWIPIAPTSFSREGKTNWIMRTLPITAREHIFGRMIVPVITQTIFQLELVIMVWISLYSKGILDIENIYYGLIACGLALILSMPLLLAGLYIDLSKPILDWDTPQRAIKQNMNVLIQMGIGVAYGTILFLSYQYIFRYLPLVVVYLIYFGLGILVTIIVYRYMEKNFAKKLITM